MCKPHAGVGLVAILMGLNLLEVLPLRFPTLDVDVRALNLPPLAVAYAAGLTFALAASPCSTPILATLLAYTSTQDTAAVGASLLFVYSLGYIAPLLVAATAAVRTLAAAEYCVLPLPAALNVAVAVGLLMSILHTFHLSVLQCYPPNQLGPLSKHGLHLQVFTRSVGCV